MFLYFLSLREGTGDGQVRVLLIGEVHAYKHNRTHTPNSSQKQCPHQTNVANLKAFFSPVFQSWFLQLQVAHTVNLKMQ